MEEKRKPRNIVMWLKSIDDHALSNFHNRKGVAYHKFFKEISERDNFRFAYDIESYIGNGNFSNVAIYKEGEIVKTNEEFKADVIYQFKKMANLDFDRSNVVITNTPEFKDFCLKINTYDYMPQFFPKTFLAKNLDEIKEALNKIKTEKVVLKPNKGSNGDDVYIWNINEVDFNSIPKDKLEDQGFLVQEFIDTSLGIPNIAISYHDLRIITHGDKISLCHVRQPVPGTLISNSHRGASITEIDIDSIPPFILNFYSEVHTEIIKKYPKPLYSMDIGIGKNGPKLIELNSHTAFPGENFKCMDRFINNLIDHLETIQ